jgi:hypothetical protein
MLGFLLNADENAAMCELRLLSPGLHICLAFQIPFSSTKFLLTSAGLSS